MSVDTLLAQLTREAEAEAESILLAARQRVGEIERNAEALAARRRAEQEATQSEVGERLIRREVAAAQRHHRELIYRERAAILDRVFQRAERALASAPPDRYRSGLRQLVEAALAFLQGTPALLRCPPDLSGALEELMAGRDGITIAPSRDAVAGVLAESTDRRVVIDHTLPGLLRRRQAELAVQLAGKLGEVR